MAQTRKAGTASQSSSNSKATNKQTAANSSKSQSRKPTAKAAKQMNRAPASEPSPEPELVEKERAVAGKKRKAPTEKGQSSDATDTTSSDVNGFSDADMAIYKAIQEKMEAKKMAAKQAEDIAIINRNRNLMNQEASGDEEAPPPSTQPKNKRQRITLELSDNEQELAKSLGPPPMTEQVTSDQEEAEEEERGDEDSEAGDAADMENVDQIDDTAGSQVDNGWGFSDNGMVVNDLDNKSVAPSIQSKKSSYTASATSSAVSTPTSNRTSSKVTEDPFPDAVTRLTFGWNAVKEVVKISKDPMHQEALNCASIHSGRKKDLIKFAMYGRTSLVSNLITKARDKVKGFYNLSGDADTIKDNVSWLMLDSHFMYGDINLKEQTYNTSKPFGSELITELMESVWFPTSSHSKADIHTTSRIIQEKSIPLIMILLACTGIEHGLKEWSTGRKSANILFSEESSRQCYNRHLANWKKIEAGSKRWATYWPKHLYTILAKNNSCFEDQLYSQDSLDVDFGALDKIAEMAGFDDI